MVPEFFPFKAEPFSERGGGKNKPDRIASPEIVSIPLYISNKKCVFVKKYAPNSTLVHAKCQSWKEA